MQVKHLSITVFSLLFSLLLPSLSQAQRVSIPDTALRAKIAEALNKAPGDTITRAEMETLVELWAVGRDITDLRGIEFAINLTDLVLWDNSISDISLLARLTNLTGLQLGYNSISDISPLARLTNLTSLGLRYNNISDISLLARLTNLTDLNLWDNSISDISPLAKLIQLTWLRLNSNNISDVSPIVGLNLTGTETDSTGLVISGNPLSYFSINTHIPTMQARGIEVEFDDRTPMTLVKGSGIAQQGPVNTALPLPFIVEVQDEQNRPFAGVPVKFRITAGRGRLSTTRTTTDTTGKASAHLTMGRTVGTTTVRVTAADVSQPVQFTAEAILRSAPVSIRDVNLHEKIAETLRKPLSATLTAADMLQLRTLTANNAGILDLTGLQYASNLTSLTLNNNSISDVSPLAGLTRLTRLDLMNNWISDVSPLVGLPRLTRLDLMNNWISDVSPLAGLNNLQRLFLQGNPLSDTSIATRIPLLQTAGVNVRFDSVPTTHEGPIVRLIYFLPRDRQPQPDINAQMDRLIKDAQQVYAQQMESQGFKRKTFKYETDANGKAVVHHLVGRFTDEYYRNLSSTFDIWEEIDEEFETSNNIYFTVIDIGSAILDGGGVCGRGGYHGSVGGKALLPASDICFNVGVAVHELGHAFGLQHDFRSDATAKRIRPYAEPMSSSFCAAEWLDAHRAFNPSQPTANKRSTFEMLPPRAAPGNAIRFRFKVTDTDGIHQVQFLTPEVDYSGSLLACKRLNGATSSTVEFVTTELRPKNESVYLQVMDVNGNFTASEEFPIDITHLLPRAKVVSLPDTNLAAAVREALDLKPGARLTTHTMLNLIRLNAPNREITDLTGLEHARNLKELNLGGEYVEGEWRTLNSNAISDFSPIAGLPHLTQLNLSYFDLSDVSFLSRLTQLERLHLESNTISDVSPIAKLKQLTYLNLYGNTLSDISPLAKLTQLTDLSLWDNSISDVSPLAKLKQLTGLVLGDNAISDISPLAGLTQLTDLRIGRNIVSDISSLTELKNLIYLYLYDNAISDISALAELTQLTQLRLNNNTISDVSPIVGLNLTGPEWEWDRVGLDIQGNPLNAASITTHIPAMRAKGIVVVFEGSTVLTQGAGEKIVGPWLWVIAPTGNSGAGAAASGIDFLSEMSDGSVTELEVATNGATAGTPVGDSRWTFHRLSPTGKDNIGQMVNAAGLGTGNIDNHVAYGTIALDAPREQQTQMFAGSDDAIKVWLNGELVHDNPVDRGARDFQDQFPVTLKKGTNILLVAVYEGWGDWSGFFGFASDAEYTVTTDEVAQPAWDVNEDGIVDATDAALVTAALGQQSPQNPRLDVNGDGVVDGKDLALVAEHLGEGDAPAGPSHPAQPLGFTLENVERTLNILRAADDGTLTFKRGIDNLEQLLARFVPERTALLHNYPNPFNPETWIPYQLAKPAEVTLHIYAVNGAVVRTLELGHQPAGVYRIRSRAAYWDGRNAVGEPVASGLYFYTLTAGDFSATRKMLIRK